MLATVFRSESRACFLRYKQIAAGQLDGIRASCSVLLCAKNVCSLTTTFMQPQQSPCFSRLAILRAHRHRRDYRASVVFNLASGRGHARIGMAGANGYEVAQHVRRTENPEPRTLHIAIIGEMPPHEVAARCCQARFDLHFGSQPM